MNKRGFTLIEMMVAVLVLAIVMAAVITVFIESDKSKRRTENIAEAQNHARAALSIVERELKSAGYGIPMNHAQPVFAFAAPFECVFNANIVPFPNDTSPFGQPRAYDPSTTPNCPNYNPGIFFNTGVETYRYFISQTDSLAMRTRNPNDAVLVRQVYGRMDDGSNQTNPTVDQQIALVRPPTDTTDFGIVPLFQYWYRQTATDTFLTLWGDADNDGMLTGAERRFGNPPASVRNSIEEVTLTITAETRNPYRDLYQQVNISTRMNLFNVPMAAVKYYLRGKYVINGTTTGVPAGEVALNTGVVQLIQPDGSYEFGLDPGSYVVRPQKVVDGGSNYFVLMNPQDSLVTVSNADVNNVNFRYHQVGSGEMGRITGRVFYDSTQNGVMDAWERGISGVSITANGKSIYTDTTVISITSETDANGYYSFTLPAGTYAVNETDSFGWFSSTPNSVIDTLAPGANDTVNYGDYKGAAGMIRIKVWHDANKDSVDQGSPSEKGLTNVLCIVTKGGSDDVEVTRGRTDANGEFSAWVPADTVYSVIEVDPDTMTSICGWSLGLSSAPAAAVSPYANRIENVIVPESDTFNIKFADAVGFVTITLGQTEKVLSLVTPDLRERRNPPGSTANPDNSNPDPDIVLGTVKASTSNLLVWYNLYVNSGTPLGSLFTANPHSSYDVGYDIPSLARANFDAAAATPSITEDVVAGLRANSGMYNIFISLTHNGGTAAGTGSPASRLDRDRGFLAWQAGTSPAGPAPMGFATQTGVASTDIMALATGLLTPSNQYDFAVGTKTADNAGHVEIWRNNGTGSSFARVQTIFSAGGVPLGEVRAIYAADVVDSLGISGKDGLTDLIVGTKTNDYPNYQGQMIIFRRAGKNLLFDHHLTINYTDGYINAIKAYNSGLPRGTILDDIAVGLRVPGSTADEYQGRVDLWHNNHNGNFGIGGLPNDQVNPGGEVLSLDAGKLDIDIYNDLVVGLKTGANSGGTMIYYTAPAGYLPSLGSDPSGGLQSGEAVVVRVIPFRPSPGRNDIIVAVRELNVSNQEIGKLVIYFNKL
jgi:prepilin-type N-terminal cleavage/methylation domain-containing protein